MTDMTAMTYTFGAHLIDWLALLSVAAVVILSWPLKGGRR